MANYPITLTTMTLELGDCANFSVASIPFQSRRDCVIPFDTMF